VAEARAEWLQAQGRSPFNELVVPATGVRLNQWAGRGIRSETDHATLVCYDGRLSGTPFGRQLLAGLPGFRRSVRGGG
jgi:ATP-dependent DNA helicase DinG